MELSHLKSFYHVAKAGSFTAAAKVLNTTQSSLSKSVGLLEHREGITLLERSKKGVKLTSVGQEIFDHCKSLFEVVHRIEDRIRGVTSKCEGLLNFGASDHIARYLLLDPLEQMKKEFPLVVPSIFVGSPHEIVEQIIKNDIEFGLFFSKINDANLEYKRISPFEMVLVSAPQYTEGYIGSISRNYQRHPSFRILDGQSKNNKLNLEANSQELQKMLCLRGQGCALLAHFMVSNELKEKQLKKLPLPQPIHSDLLLVKRKRHTFTRSAQKFIDNYISKLK